MTWKPFAAAVAAVVLAAASAPAATYYVSPQGDDKNPGASPDKPWATLAKGLDAVRSGDELVIGEGDYLIQKPLALRGIPLANEDTTKPVLIRAARPQMAVIHGDIPLTGFARVEGMRFTWRCPMKENVLSMVESDTDIVYQRAANPTEVEEVLASFCWDKESGALYVHTTNGGPPDAHALWASVTGFGISYQYSSTGEGPGRTLLLDGLVFKGFDVMALDLRYARNMTIRNCVFYHNRYGVYLSNFVRRCRVESNLFFSNNYCPTSSPENAPCVISGDAADVVVDGNVSRYNRWNSIRAYGESIPEGGRVVFSNNRSFGEAPFWFKPCVKGSFMTGNVSEGIIRGWNCSHNTAAAKMQDSGPDGEDDLIYRGAAGLKAAHFVDPVNGDFRLQSDSPFRGKGKDGADLGALPYKGDVFFVRPDGNDAGEGTSIASAWKSLPQAVQRLKPGHTLCIMAGTYTEPVTLSTAADADHPITLRRYARDRAVLDVQGKVTAALLLEGARHVRIEGLEIRGPCTGDMEIRGRYPAAVVAKGASDVRIEECLLVGNSAGVSLSECGAVTLRNNTVTENSRGLRASGAQGELQLVGNILQANRSAQLSLDAASAKQYYGNFNCFFGAKLAEVDGKEVVSPEQLPKLLGERPGSMVADAAFASPAKGDFRLAVGSPCRGRGHLERTIGRNDLVSPLPEGLKFENVRVHFTGGTNATLTYWTPLTPCETVLEYGVGNEPPQRATLELGRRIFHAVALKGLKPNTDYWFRPGGKHSAESWIEYTRRAWGQAGGQAADREAFGDRATFRTLAADPPGRTLYVRADGDDTKDGLSQVTAWRTLRQAAMNAHAGDTVLVGPGRYFETLSPYNTGLAEDKRIIFRAEKPREAILDGKDFALPYAFKVLGRDYITLDGFRLEYQKATDYDMSSVGPWSAQALLSQAKFCTIARCYIYGGRKFPEAGWTALMGLRLDNAEGARIEDNFFFYDTWSVWTTSNEKPGPGYVMPFFKNNTFFVQHIWAFHVTGRGDWLKFRNNLFAEYVRAKWGHRYLSIWYPWDCKLDSDYNFFWWHNDKKEKPQFCIVGSWHNGKMQRIGDVPGGLAGWRETTGQDQHSLDAFFPTNNLYDDLDFTIAGKPYQGKGENGEDIGCTWVGKHSDQVVFESGDSKVDVPPWRKK